MSRNLWRLLRLGSRAERMRIAEPPRYNHAVGLTVFAVTYVGGTYLTVNYPRIKESLQLKRDRYFGAPSVKEAIVQRENLEKRLDKVINEFGPWLKRYCLEETKANSVLKHVENNYGQIDLDAMISLDNLMDKADCSTPEGLLLEGARLGEKQAHALVEKHKHSEWVARYGEGLTKDEIEWAKTSWHYRWKVERSVRARAYQI